MNTLQKEEGGSGIQGSRSQDIRESGNLWAGLSDPPLAVETGWRQTEGEVQGMGIQI